MTYRILLAGLLFLISVTFIFTTPGINQFESPEKIIIHDGQSLNKTILLKSFSENLNQLEYRTPAWTFIKFELYAAYLLTLIAFYYFAKRTSKNYVSFLQVANLFFINFPILLIAVSLGYNNILAAPFLLIALYLYIKQKRKLFIFFYALSSFFDLSLLILLPVIALRELRQRGVEVSRNQLLLALGLIIVTAFSISDKLAQFLIMPQFLIPNIPWLLQQPLQTLTHTPSHQYIVLSILILASAIICFGYFIRAIAGTRGLVFAAVILLSTFLLNDFLIMGQLIFFVGASALLYLNIIKKPSTDQSFFQALFIQYLLFTLLFPIVSLGNLLWLSVFGLLLYIINFSEINRKIYLSQALIIFLVVFLFVGTAGSAPISGPYYQYMTLLCVIFFNCSGLWLFQKLINNGFKSTNLGLILLMVLVNFSFITANGSSDVVAWAEYSRASIIQPNPFAAQAISEIDQRYPPLNTLIMGSFANGWHYLVGPDPSYAIATKLSVFLFYIMTVFVLFRFTPNTLSKTQKTLIILTTFSLIIQTQGFADVNIYLAPSLLGAIIMLFRRQYFWAGLLMGITMSIKWQPVITIPLFFLTIIGLRESWWEITKKIITFTVPFLFLPIFTWWLVIINPGGWDAFNRATEYLVEGAPALSGQALNVNWVVTYYLHYAYPETFNSLSHLDYMNVRVPTNLAPKIWHGYLFLVVTAFVLLKYWLSRKKDLIQFCSAALIIFFSHHQLNKSAYEKHLFYTVLFMLFLYLLKPTNGNKKMLILFDIMVVMNLIFFYGFTGPKDINRMFFSIDLTIIFAIYYFIIFCWVLWRYFRKDNLLLEDETKDP